MRHPMRCGLCGELEFSAISRILDLVHSSERRLSVVGLLRHDTHESFESKLCIRDRRLFLQACNFGLRTSCLRRSAASVRSDGRPARAGRPAYLNRIRLRNANDRRNRAIGASGAPVRGVAHDAHQTHRTNAGSNETYIIIDMRFVIIYAATRGPPVPPPRAG